MKFDNHLKPMILPKSPTIYLSIQYINDLQGNRNMTMILIYEEVNYKLSMITYKPNQKIFAGG